MFQTNTGRAAPTARRLHAQGQQRAPGKPWGSSADPSLASPQLSHAGQPCVGPGQPSAQRLELTLSLVWSFLWCTQGAAEMCSGTGPPKPPSGEMGAPARRLLHAPTPHSVRTCRLPLLCLGMGEIGEVSGEPGSSWGGRESRARLRGAGSQLRDAGKAWLCAPRQRARCGGAASRASLGERLRRAQRTPGEVPARDAQTWATRDGGE